MINKTKIALASFAILSVGNPVSATETATDDRELIVHRSPSWPAHPFSIDMRFTDKATCSILACEYGSNGRGKIMTSDDVIILDSSKYSPLEYVTQPITPENPNHVYMVPKKTAVSWPRQLDVNGHLVEKSYENLHRTNITLSALPVGMNFPDGYTTAVSSHHFMFYICNGLKEKEGHLEIFIKAQVEGKKSADLQMPYFQFISGICNGKIVIGSKDGQTIVQIVGNNSKWNTADWK